MRRAKHETPLFAVCLNNTEYPAALELHKIYRVIADEDAAQEGDTRVVDESGEDYLYPANWFAMVELLQEIQASVLRAAAQSTLKTEGCAATGGAWCGRAS